MVKGKRNNGKIAMLSFKILYKSLRILLLNNFRNILVIKEVITKIIAVATILVIRKYEAHFSNDYSYYLAIILNLSMFAGFSIPSTFQIHFLNKRKINFIFIVLILLLVFLLSLIVILVLKWSNSNLGVKYLLDYEYIYALTVSNILFQLIQYIYLGLKKIRLFSFSMIIYSLISSVGLLIIIFSNISEKIVYYFTFSIILSFSFIVIGFINLFKDSIIEFSILINNDFNELKEILKLSSRFFLVGIPVLTSNYYLNEIFIINNELYGFTFQWAISSQIMNLIMLPANAKLPMIMNLFHENSTQYQKVIRNELRLSILLTLLSCFCAIGLSCYLNLNFTALFIYILSAPFQIYLLVNSQLLFLQFKRLAFFLNSVWGITFSLLLYLFSIYGFEVICFAYSISYVFTFLIMIGYNRNVIRIKFFNLKALL